METIEIKAYKCQYCGSIHLLLDDAVRCEMLCEARSKAATDREVWYEANKPKYAEGDVVEVVDTYCNNRYFRIISISKADKSYPEPHWRYYGEVGELLDGFFDPEVCDSIPENKIKCVVRTSAEFEAICKAIKERFQISGSEFSIVHNSAEPMAELTACFKLKDYE